MIKKNQEKNYEISSKLLEIKLAAGGFFNACSFQTQEWRAQDSVDVRSGIT